MVSVIRAAGGVVYCYDETGTMRILLILDKHGIWGFPKGHLDTGESEQEAAIREIAEETAMDCTIGPLVERVSYRVFKNYIEREKMVAYFLAQTSYTPPVPQIEEGISEARWVSPADAMQMVFYPQIQQVLQRALTMLTSNPHASGIEE